MPLSEEDCNSNFSFSLAKGFSAPRKCSICQKTMFYKAYRCKHCRYRNQKKLSSHGSSSRRNSVPKCYTGDEHWSKVLQANEVNSNLVGWLTCKKHRVCQCGRVKHKSDKDKDGDGKETNFFTSLYSRFCEWVANAKKDSVLDRRNGGSANTTSGGRPRSGSAGTAHFRSCHLDGSLTPGSPSDDEFHRYHHASVSSEDSELSSFYVASYSSTCSNLTLTSTSTTVSDCVRTYDPWACSPTFPRLDGSSDCAHDYTSIGVYDDPCGSPLTPDYDFYPAPHESQPTDSSALGESCFSGQSIGLEYDRDSVLESLDQKAAKKRSRFRRTKHPSVSVWLGQGQKEDIEKHFLCATWPPTNRRKHSISSISTERSNNELEESVFDSDELTPEEHSATLSYGIRESLGDCTIPFSDVEFGDQVRTGRKHEIYRGRWHGDVMIHTYSNLSDSQVEEFWNEVTKLSMIRHENIALFMGACLEPPNFAVITSVLKGVSLYQQIHLKSKNEHQRLYKHDPSSGTRMGYLHARGIVIRKLNSKNVYLERKVKLCVMDYSMAEREYDRMEYGCIPRGNLCYISPEIMRTLRVIPPSLEALAPYTKATDVYAFGTLLFETMVGQFPFSRMLPEVIIWQIGRGKRQSLKHLKLNSSLRVLIEKCWSRNPENRLTFAEINKELQFNAALHKRHSSSNPERINHQGLNSRTATMFP